MARDDLYALPRDRVGQFRFDDSVAEVFGDMISRSVPGYASILSVIEQLAERYVRPKSNVYDLGCSLGAATWLIRRQAPADATIHAVDNSAAMTRRLQQKLDEASATQVGPDPATANARRGPDDRGGCRVQVHLADVCDVPMRDASLIVLNFTLQFIPADRRDALLRRAFGALRPGGALVLSEKICFADPGQQHLLADLHLDFKRACGYSELEIAQKRTALEETLIPESLETHLRRLRGAGFGTVAPWFQCFNFASLLAIKTPDAP